MNSVLKPLVVVALCSLLNSPAARSQASRLEVAGVFSDHAVLQQDFNIPVWGTATPRASVLVEFGDQSISTIADVDGKWSVTLDPMNASVEGRALSVRSADINRVFPDVVVGEVWLASGQSNMQFSMDACAKRLEAVKEVMANPNPIGVRMLRIGSAESEKPINHLDRKQHRWSVDSPRVRGGQSAVAFLFARRLHQELKIPIGIIETSWGGKPIEGFIPRGEFERHEALQPILRLADANSLGELKTLEGGVWVRNKAGLPGRIFNARLAPVAGFPVRGSIWYQGESNAGTEEDPRNYRHKMRALIEGWRKAWKQDEMPFYFVQLPSFRNEFDGWTRLREEQRLSLEVPQTGMAVTIDLRDTDIHPANKIDVAKRLARWALAREYRTRKLAYSGPLFKSLKITGSSVRVRFSHAGEGLMAARKEGLEPPVETPDAALGEFEVADKSGTWHPATATIDRFGRDLLVSSDKVSKPVAVRYACRGAPANANLYNRAGLPASPFCSDLELLPWPRPGLEK